jgi:hypothetical protein
MNTKANVQMTQHSEHQTHNTLTRRFRGQVKDAVQASHYWLDSRLFGNKRPSKDAFDFGDVATVGKHLKRSDLGFHDLDINIDFGIFLGEHEDGWVVGIKNEDGTRLTGAEVFESLSDLKRSWILD